MFHVPKIAFKYKHFSFFPLPFFAIAVAIANFKNGGVFALILGWKISQQLTGF